jgi:tetratricopeptide (TPR) repeat protein
MNSQPQNKQTALENVTAGGDVNANIRQEIHYERNKLADKIGIVAQSGSNVKIDQLNINNADRNVSLDDWKPSFEHMQGRKEAIAALDIALADPKKAIACIVGLGGYGKSTLAAKLFDGWKGGRFWADLSQRSRDFREFATRAIAQLGQKSLEQVNNLPEVDLGYELAAVLQGQGYLVVLDNLESLLDGDGNLESVLWREFLGNWANDGEGSKVLITTREEPNLPKLRFFRYELRDGLEDAEGAAVLRDFGILGTKAELVAVSQRVGGIPLSLMLVVGLLCNDYEEEPHVRFLPDDLFGIEGAHRLGRVTTEAVFRASFERLEPRLQSLLMAVSVFAKPFDRPMAAAMIADEEVTDRDLLLLKKRGFVLAESGCYRFQPQIQELVQRQAADLPELHRRAINFYLTLCEAKPALDPRHDTIEDADPYLQVFHHCCELGQYENAFYTIRNDSNDIDKFLTLRGYYVKKVDLYLELANALHANKLKEFKYMDSLFSLGNSFYSLGQYQEAIKSYGKSLGIAKELNDEQSQVNSYLSLGNTYRISGQHEIAKSYYEKSLSIAQKIGYDQGKASVLGGLGDWYYLLRDYKSAIMFHEQSLVIKQEIDHKSGQAFSLVGLGNAYSALGQYQKAESFYQRALDIAKLISYKHTEAISYTGLGFVHRALGNYKRAICFYRKSLKIAQDSDDNQGKSVCFGNLGNTYLDLGRYQKAISFYQQSLEIQQKISDKRGEITSLVNLANVLFQTGRLKKGLLMLDRASQIFLKIQLPVKPKHYAEWLILFIRFAQRGKWQIALSFFIGLFAFPLFLSYLVTLLLWRLIKGKVKR